MDTDIPLLQLQLIMQEAQLHSYLFYMTKVCTLPDMDLIFLKSFIISATLELSMVLPAYRVSHSEVYKVNQL